MVQGQDESIKHEPECNGKGTSRGQDWPMCCGSKSQIEEFYDDVFDDVYLDDYNMEEAKERT